MDFLSTRLYNTLRENGYDAVTHLPSDLHDNFGWSLVQEACNLIPADVQLLRNAISSCVDSTDIGKLSLDEYIEEKLRARGYSTVGHLPKGSDEERGWSIVMKDTNLKAGHIQFIRNRIHTHSAGIVMTILL
jgi:hypothetical protein